MRRPSSHQNEYLCKHHGDFQMETIKRIQIVDSRDLQIMQLADLFIGAISYYNRGLSRNNSFSSAKRELVELIEDLSGVDLGKKTNLSKQKFNVFVWNAWGD